jgi:hypothetical protein
MHLNFADIVKDCSDALRRRRFDCDRPHPLPATEVIFQEEGSATTPGNFRFAGRCSRPVCVLCGARIRTFAHARRPDYLPRCSWTIYCERCAAVASECPANPHDPPTGCTFGGNVRFSEKTGGAAQPTAIGAPAMFAT